MTDQALPRENLFRDIGPTLARIEVRDGVDGEAPMLSVRFAVFDEWAEIDSEYEGHFLERFAPGSLDESLAADTPKILFQHGKDANLGHMPIAAPVTARSDDVGAVLEGPLLDGVPQLLMSGLRSGVYGASMQFHVGEQVINRSPERSDHNPQGLTERTVTKARVREGGPVTWGAYAGAGASIRSSTDEFRPRDLDAEIAQMAREHPNDLAKMIERALGHTKAADKPPAEKPQPPRFRTREEFLTWMSRT
jgi:hypothetical protein